MGLASSVEKQIPRTRSQRQRSDEQLRADRRAAEEGTVAIVPSSQALDGSAARAARDVNSIWLQRAWERPSAGWPEDAGMPPGEKPSLPARSPWH